MSQRPAIFQALQAFTAPLEDMPDGAFFAMVEDEAQRLMDQHGVTDTDSNSMMFEYFDWCNQQDQQKQEWHDTQASLEASVRA